MSTVIQIRGAGMSINNELAIVRTAMESAGFSVEVSNDCPPERPDAEIVQRIANLMNEGVKFEVRIEMVHEPWGG